MGPDPQTTVSLNWRKPIGGDELIGYTLKWFVKSGYLSSNFVAHYPGITNFNYEKRGLIPGEVYQIEIYSFNSAGNEWTYALHETREFEYIYFGEKTFKLFQNSNFQ